MLPFNPSSISANEWGGVVENVMENSWRLGLLQLLKSKNLLSKTVFID